MTVFDLLPRLPDVEVLEQRSRVLAVLDAILCPDWDLRYHSFDAVWSERQRMGSMRDGSGTASWIVFSDAGAFVQGFDHESPMTPFRVSPPAVWPGLLDQVPDAFADELQEPAFGDSAGVRQATVCCWRVTGDPRWSTGDVALPPGDDIDGADAIFGILTDGTGEAYRRYAADYFEVEVDPAVIRTLIDGTPLTPALARSLNPETDWAELRADIERTGYPMAG
jgi:hypothetical protein